MKEWYGYVIIPIIAFLIIVRPGSSEELIGRLISWAIISFLGIVGWQYGFKKAKGEAPKTISEELKERTNRILLYIGLAVIFGTLAIIFILSLF